MLLPLFLFDDELSLLVAKYFVSILECAPATSIRLSKYLLPPLPDEFSCLILRLLLCRHLQVSGLLTRGWKKHCCSFMLQSMKKVIGLSAVPSWNILLYLIWILHTTLHNTISHRNSLYLQSTLPYFYFPPHPIHHDQPTHPSYPTIPDPSTPNHITRKGRGGVTVDMWSACDHGKLVDLRSSPT